MKDPITVYNVGVNRIMAGDNSKLSLNFQSRPIFIAASDGTLNHFPRKLVLQYQLAF